MVGLVVGQRVIAAGHTPVPLGTERPPPTVRLLRVPKPGSVADVVTVSARPSVGS